LPSFLATIDYKLLASVYRFSLEGPLGIFGVCLGRYTLVFCVEVCVAVDGLAGLFAVEGRAIGVEWVGFEFAAGRLGKLECDGVLLIEFAAERLGKLECDGVLLIELAAGRLGKLECDGVLLIELAAGRLGKLECDGVLLIELAAGRLGKLECDGVLLIEFAAGRLGKLECDGVALAFDPPLEEDLPPNEPPLGADFDPPNDPPDDLPPGDPPPEDLPPDDPPPEDLPPADPTLNAEVPGSLSIYLITLWSSYSIWSPPDNFSYEATKINSVTRVNKTLNLAIS